MMMIMAMAMIVIMMAMAMMMMMIPFIINEKKGNSFDLSELFSSNIVAKSML